MKTRNILIFALSIGATSIASAQSKVTVVFDWITQNYSVRTDDSDGPILKRTEDARHRVNVGDEVGVIIANINPKLYGAKFKIETRPAAGRALIEGITGLLTDGVKSSAGGQNQGDPSGLNDDLFNIFRAELAKAAVVIETQLELKKFADKFDANYARTAVSDFQRQVTASVRTKAELENFALSKDSISALKKDWDSRIKSTKDALDHWRNTVDPNPAADSADLRTARREYSAQSLTIEAIAKLSKECLAVINLASDDDNFTIESDTKVVTDSDDIIIVTELSAKKPSDDAEEQKPFSDLFFAKRELKDYSVGIAYDELVDQSFVIRNDVIALGATDSHRIGLNALYHIPFGNDGGSTSWAFSLGAGIKTDEELRTYFGLSLYFGKEKRGVFTIGYAFGKVTKLDGYELGNSLPEGETTIPTKRATDKKMFIGFSFRQ